eukprot:1346704-Rhodomonas_salina.1
MVCDHTPPQYLLPLHIPAHTLPQYRTSPSARAQSTIKHRKPHSWYHELYCNCGLSSAISGCRLLALLPVGR